MPYEEAEQRRLLEIARASIAHGLEHGGPADIDTAGLPEALQRVGAAFVTLRCGGALRGCIGTLEAYRPLAVDVAANACASAFQDPRFPPLIAAEIGRLEIQISVLGPAMPIAFSDEEDLCAQLRPGVDGVILQLGRKRATFLPAVWESLSQPRQFLAALRQKARIEPAEDVRAMQAWRYTTESFAER